MKARVGESFSKLDILSWEKFKKTNRCSFTFMTMKQAEKPKSCKMVKDKGWMMKVEWWRMKASSWLGVLLIDG